MPGPEWASSGIEGFLRHLRRPAGLHILDLGSISQGTARVLGERGHHIHCLSLLHGFDAVRESSMGEDGNVTPHAANRFVRTHLDFPKNSVHAVLAWDVLQHLDELTMRATIAFLSKLIRPNGIMFCLFHVDTTHETIPVLNCSMKSESTLQLSEVERRTPFRRYSVRNLEALFPQYRALHFCLKRDAILEVLVFS